MAMRNTAPCSRKNKSFKLEKVSEVSQEVQKGRKQLTNRLYVKTCNRRAGLSCYTNLHYNVQTV
jgi:hypothetical protein